jgi:prevent-host-death family protein
MGRPVIVGAFEAKTRLSELLREVERGASFVIQRRGKTVARLVPPARAEQAQDLAQILAGFRRIRQRIRGRVKIRELIEEGRRR